MTKISLEEIRYILEEYNTGQCTIASLSQSHGISAGKLYYLLKDAGCAFSRKRRKPVSDEERRRRSEAAKGKIRTAQQRQRMSEAKACNYNGLNGYGHLKKHNCGYVLAYVPKHPKAHKDGYVMYHTIVVERAIGRYLKDDEIIHHINHNRADNRLDNLKLMTKREHMSMHMKERHKNKGGMTY